MLAVQVPGTTSNLAHGFDCLGAALTLTNTLQATPSDGVVSSGHPGLVDLAEQVRERVQSAWGVAAPALDLSISGDVPAARGLGSSATILLAAAAIYQRLAGRDFDRDELLRLTIPLEGHPDNLVAAACGGLAVAAPFADAWRYRAIALPAAWRLVVVIPDHEVRTSVAREALPAHIARAEAVQAWQHTAWLVAALTAGDVSALRGAFADGWHERYRQAVNPRLVGVRAAAEHAGAIGTFLSGSGSTIIALTEDVATAQLVARHIEQAGGLSANDAVRIAGFSQDGMRFVE